MWVIIPLLIILFVFILLSVAQIGAMFFATRFFAELYRPPDGVVPSKLINYRLNAKIKLPPPLNIISPFKFIIVKDGQD